MTAADDLAPGQLMELCRAFDWQGGTFHQVLDEIRRLRTQQKSDAETLRAFKSLFERAGVAMRPHSSIDAATLLALAEAIEVRP